MVEVIGNWGLIDNISIEGKLIVKQTEIYLELDRIIGPTLSFNVNNSTGTRFNFVYGVDEEGAVYSLHGVVFDSMHGTLPDIQIKYQVLKAFKGSQEEIFTVKSIKFHSDMIDQWMNSDTYNGFHHRISNESLDVRVRLVESTINEFSIDFDNSVDFIQARMKIDWIRSFFNFILYIDCEIHDIIFTDEDDQEIEYLIEKQSRPSSAIHLFTNNQFVSLLKSWLDHYSDHFNSIIGIYSELLKSRINIIESRFLLLMQALEGIHRFYYPSQRYTNPDNMLIMRGDMIRSLDSSVSTDHKNSLKARLKYAYEYSQRKRFYQLFECLKDFLDLSLDRECVFYLENDSKHYEHDSGCELRLTDVKHTELLINLLSRSTVGKIIELRNKFVHQTDNFSATDYQYLLKIPGVLKLIFHYHVLLNVGFDTLTYSELCSLLRFVIYNNPSILNITS